MKYQINKNYESQPSKNRVIETGLDLDTATAYLNRTEINWGGSVNKGEFYLVVEEEDGSETITFSIEEED